MNRFHHPSHLRQSIEAVRRSVLAPENAPQPLTPKEGGANENSATLIDVLEYLIECTADIAPEPNCSCHIHPPCHDCVEWGGLRDALDNARAAIAKAKGE